MKNSSGRKVGHLSGLYTHIVPFSLTTVSHCYHDDEKSADCPVCCRLFNDLAKHLPFAHCGQSRLICNLTGESMNENNPPMILPNGFAYSENVGIKFVP